MKRKKEYLILFVLIVALSLYLVVGKRDRSQQLPSIPEIPASEISKIEISKPDAKILLEKKDGKWTISPEGYPADTTKVKGMLDTIGKLSLTALVSESKSYERYDLHKERKISVKAWAGDSLRRQLDMGKAAPSFRHTFVKIAGDDRVYHARDNFRGKFDQTVDTLRDKAVLRFEENEIQKVKLNDGKSSVSLVRKEVPVQVETGKEGDKKASEPAGTTAIWQSSDGRAVEESRLQRMLSTLSVLNCTGYIKGAVKSDFTKPVYSIRLEGLKTYTLSLFEKTNKEDRDRPATSSENGYPFRLSDFQVNRIMVPLQEILKKPEKS